MQHLHCHNDIATAKSMVWLDAAELLHSKFQLAGEFGWIIDTHDLVTLSLLLSV